MVWSRQLYPDGDTLFPLLLTVVQVFGSDSVHGGPGSTWEEASLWDGAAGALWEGPLSDGAHAQGI